MAGSSIFADLKMSVESLKSQGNLLSSASGNPGSGPGGKGTQPNFGYACSAVAAMARG